MAVIGCTKDWLDQNNELDSVSINPNYCPIDWDNATLSSSNDSNGTYQIQFNGVVPDIHPGSIITIDKDTIVRHIFVENISVEGNTINIGSSEAYLTDIFSNTDFTLTTANQSKSSTKGGVFHPVKVFLLNDNGVYQPLKTDNNIKGLGFTHNLWQYKDSNDDQVLFSGDNYSIYMERMYFDFNLDLDIYMNFGGRTVHEIVGNAINRYRSQALNLEASLVGTFNTEQQVRCDIQGICRYNPGYDIWRHNLFRPLRVKYIVYGVPIVITLNADLYRQVELTASGKISAYIGITDNAEGRLGFNWHQSNGMTPVSSFKNTFDFIPPSIEGRGLIQAKVWAFPRVRVLLYDFIGPSFDFKPYFSTTIQGGFLERLLGQSTDYCAWSFDCNTGLDANCGLSLQFLGYEIENQSTPNWNIINKLLYHSPKKIVHVSGQPTPGQCGTVRFNIYDQNLLLNTEVLTSLPQIVKFESFGQISSEYGIAVGGSVSVNWTPVANDILYAKLYDINGNVIAWSSVQTRNDWVDLGLPSGTLWATRNVGASSPTDYGNYYAWGETTTKSVYAWSTYLYYRSDNNGSGLTKYCNCSECGYNGFTDNLIRLQSDDDVAAVNHCGNIPTKAQWEELFNHTTKQWTNINGTNGLLLTGSNGCSIFLPAAGCLLGSSLGGVNIGFYWSSSLDTEQNYANNAWYVYFTSDQMGHIYHYLRCRGQNVRAVCNPYSLQKKNIF